MLNPILKWAGGKQRQLKHIFPLMPEGLRLIEPFVGGGSVFTNSDKHGSFLLTWFTAIHLMNRCQARQDSPITHLTVLNGKIN